MYASELLVLALSTAPARTTPTVKIITLVLSIPVCRDLATTLQLQMEQAVLMGHGV